MEEAKYNWQEYQPSEYLETITNYLEQNNLPLELNRYLDNLQLHSEADLDLFFNANIDKLHDPFALYDMEKAVQRIKTAIINNERILIYGDYDCDGITSTTVLKEALEMLGAEPEFYLPNRFTDGYGPNIDVYKYYIESGVDLIITVDNGIAGFEALQYAKDQGIDVIVTDHHELQNKLPEAYAIIHPRHPKGNYPFGDLAGVGVAFKVATALLEYVPTELLDLVALGTVADLVSLTDENRILVKEGLKVLQNSERIGLNLLAKKADFNLKTATEETIGFNIAPRLNALGRLEDANPGVTLLNTFDDLEADEIADKIEKLNLQRKDLVKQIVNEAKTKIKPEDAVQILYSDNWHEGVLGIVASQIVELTSKPTLILHYDVKNNTLKGSGRSIEAINLAEILQQHADEFIAFGGHHMAVGLTITLDNLKKLQPILNEEIAKIPITKNTLLINQTLTVNEITIKYIENLKLLAPFGTENLKPLVKIVKPEILDLKVIGKDASHLKGDLVENDHKVNLIGFNYASSKRTLLSGDLELVGELSINEWNNKKTPQVQLKDFQITSCQLFDGRMQHFLNEDYLEEDALFVYFNPNNFDTLKRWLPNKELFLASTITDNDNRQIVLLDQPQTLTQLQSLIKQLGAISYVLVFNITKKQYLVMPTRELFTKLFKFIKTITNYDVRHHLVELSQQLQIERESLIVMIKVFEELGFVIINDGILTPVSNPQKRNLDESLILQKQKEAREINNFLTLSSLKTLKSWFLTNLDEK